MSDNQFNDENDGGAGSNKPGVPYKIVDHTRSKRKGITAASFQEMMDIARARFEIPEDTEITVVLEQDGTEIDDEDYFATLDRNSSLMILHDDQKWTSPGSSSLGLAGTSGISGKQLLIVGDDTDSIASLGHHAQNFKQLQQQQRQQQQLVLSTALDRRSCQLNIGSLVSSLHNEPSQISLLGGPELEKLSDMDPESLADIVSDRLFLEQLKEASGRFLAEKRQAQESMALLRMYASSSEIEQA